MFVQSVSHTFSYSGGFSTSCELTSAASLTDDITWLPRAGLESVIDQIPAGDPINDLPENDPNILD